MKVEIIVDSTADMTPEMKNRSCWAIPALAMRC